MAPMLRCEGSLKLGKSGSELCPALWPKASYLTSLSLKFLVNKNGPGLFKRIKWDALPKAISTKGKMPRTYNLEPCCLIFWCFQCPGPMLSCFWCFNGTYNWLSELYERYAFASIKIPILLFLSGQITLNWCCILLSEGGSVPSHQNELLFSLCPL